MKKVAFIQSREYFTQDQQNKYLSDILSITTTNPVEIYKFIKSNANKNCIFKYILHIDSGVLSSLIDYIYEKKNKSVNVKALLSKCTLVATFSNADSVREKNIKLQTNILFSLSPISSVLKVLNVPLGKYMYIISDTNTPYYNEIYNSISNPKFRISDPNLTIEVINNFNLIGGLIVFALDKNEEYSKCANLILSSDWRKAICYIEIGNNDSILKLKDIVAKIHCISSGLSITGDIYYYSDLNNLLLYENCAVILLNQYKLWEQHIQNKVISITPANHNTHWTCIQ
jgi:hypothetical protein